MKTVLLNGIEFELGKPMTALDVNTRYFHRTLWDCYDRPSKTKENIYQFWSNWFSGFKDWNYGVSSYNCNFFSLTGVIFTEDNKTYFVLITRCHNRAYEIV